MEPSPGSKVNPAALPSTRGLIAWAWQSNAQMFAALLLGMVATLLAVHGYGLTRWGCKPTELNAVTGTSYRIDVNQADRAELMQLPRVGENLAARIVAHRQEHGDFQTVQDLRKVHGIGDATLEHVRPWVAASSQTVKTNPSPQDQPNQPKSVRKPVSSKKEANLVEPININRAGLEELQRLPGIGTKLAQRILDQRSKAPFGSVEDLRRVAGIGPKKLERLRPLVVVTDTSDHIVAGNGK